MKWREFEFSRRRPNICTHLFFICQHSFCIEYIRVHSICRSDIFMNILWMQSDMLICHIGFIISLCIHECCVSSMSSLCFIQDDSFRHFIADEEMETISKYNWFRNYVRSITGIFKLSIGESNILNHHCYYYSLEKWYGAHEFTPEI